VAKFTLPLHGHLVGDDVLKQVASILKESVRESDIVARWGGEEFCLLLPDTNSEGGVDVAEKIRKEVENGIFVSGINVTISFGVSLLRKEDDASSWFKRVDDALYQSKEGGRNRTTLL